MEGTPAATASGVGSKQRVSSAHSGRAVAGKRSHMQEMTRQLKLVTKLLNQQMREAQAERLSDQENDPSLASSSDSRRSASKAETNVDVARKVHTLQGVMGLMGTVSVGGVQAGDSILHHACAQGNEDAVVWLLREEICEVNQPSQGSKSTPLHRAAEAGHSNIVRLLVRDFGALANQANCNGWTPLHYAAEMGHNEIVKILMLDGRASLEASTGNLGDTPLHLACYKGHESTVKALLEAWTLQRQRRSNGRVDAADFNGVVNIRNGKGETPVHQAAASGFDSICKLLIRHYGALKNPHDNDSNTPLHHAASEGRDGTLVTLCRELGCAPDVPDHYGYTPLHNSAAIGNASSCKVLIEECGANVRARAKDGDTALHLAASLGRESTCVVLMASAFEVMARNAPSAPAAGGVEDGGSSVVPVVREEEAMRDYSAVEGMSDLLECRNEAGYTPLQRALHKNQLSCAQILVRMGSSFDQLLPAGEESAPQGVFQGMDSRFLAIPATAEGAAASDIVAAAAGTSADAAAVVLRERGAALDLMECMATPLPRPEGGESGCMEAFLQWLRTTPQYMRWVFRCSMRKIREQQRMLRKQSEQFRQEQQALKASMEAVRKREAAAVAKEKELVRKEKDVREVTEHMQRTNQTVEALQMLLQRKEEEIDGLKGEMHDQRLLLTSLQQQRSDTLASGLNDTKAPGLSAFFLRSPVRIVGTVTLGTTIVLATCYYFVSRPSE